MKRGRRSLGPLLVLVLGSIAGGCAPAGAGSGLVQSPAASRTSTLEVENRAWNDLNIYVVSGQSRYRLGRVAGSATETFALPGHLLSGPVQLMASPIGFDTGHLSELVSFIPGQQAHWRLEDSLGTPYPRHSAFSHTVIPARSNPASRRF